MNSVCPSGLTETAKIDVARRMFGCEPCRELIQFFGVRAREVEMKQVSNPCAAIAT
jgi:hypothetical protein